MVIDNAPEVTSISMTRDDMLSERARLIAESGMSEDDLREAGAAWRLNSDLRGILDRINGLDFLLDHAPAA